MQKLLVFAGTTEGRQALELLNGPGRELWASAATEYGGESLPALPGLHVLTGRMTESAIKELLRKERFTCVLDATHPFAEEITRNIRAACEGTGTRYVRVVREADGRQPESLTYVESVEEAAQYLARNTEGGALLTTGSKELAAFTVVPGFAERLFPRVLPVAESLEKCLSLGFPARNIICMQGPFTAELNAAMLRQTGARWLVTKETGAAGGFPEKCEGARLAGARVLVIGRPHAEEGVTVSGLAKQLERESGAHRPASARGVPSFPLFVGLSGKTAVVLGGGPIAARRVQVLSGFGCRIRVIAPELCPELSDWLPGRENIEHIRRAYRPGDCSGAALVIAATNDRAVNAEIARECAVLGVPVSVADCKEESTFYFPGIIRRGSVVIGVTASGQNHGLARAVTQRIREEAVRLIGENGEEEE